MTTLAEPVVVLSDVHLNAWSDWRGDLEELRGLWTGARTVIFNGDTMNRNLSRPPARREKVFALIRRLCEQDGAAAVIIGGNADYHVPGPRHVTLADGRILVLHGDVVFDNISPWRGNAPRMGAVRAAVLEAMDPRQRNTLEGQLESVREALRMVESGQTGVERDSRRILRRLYWYFRWVTRPWRVLRVLWIWHIMPARAGAFLARYAPEAECMIFGHAHHHGMWRARGRTVINTGGFERPLRPMIARIADGRILLCKALKTGGAYHVGKTVASYTLVAAPPSDGAKPAEALRPGAVD